ncbi:MAG: phosphoheptose isomerase [Rhodospirillales bacterium RIFCSPLOWO2_12_FULL_58_28]|nr:MAG: phosphoheptose isomerase [Rhodospirillales bacterium RIFCSPLOWO2_02_FULL_58_16]OHC77918.1 MAG: phosphoheptose isomerase [Rhodospirillales bacterium RIFCSPLOWO2_12_FULL_58_28]
MDLNVFFKSQLDEHERVLAATRDALGEPFAKLVKACLMAAKAGDKIVFFGNGGSAADAQHLATELTVRFKKDRAPIPALALTTDTSTLTAIGNDFGFDQLFARQVQANVRPGDVVIGFSTSGTSINVINGLIAAKKIGAVAVGFGAGKGGAMADICDLILLVPSGDTARIQEMHITLGHMLCGALESELGLL